MSSLVVFGDSWVCGSGIQDELGVRSPYAFGNLLAQSLNVDNFINCGVEGSSNSRSVLELLNYIDNHNVNDHIAIFFITAPERTCVIDREGNLLNIRSGDFSDGDPAISKAYVHYFSSTAQLNFECYKNIIAMQQICKQHRIVDYYIIGWSDLDIKFPGLDQSKFFYKTAAQIIGYRDNADFALSLQNQYLADDCHPNKQGHELIAHELYQWLKQQQDISNLINKK